MEGMVFIMNEFGIIGNTPMIKINYKYKGKIRYVYTKEVIKK